MTPAGASENVAGYLSSFAIFFALIGIIWHPLRLIPISIVLALVAAAVGGRSRRLAGAAVAITSICFFLGTTIAIVTERPLW